MVMQNQRLAASSMAMAAASPPALTSVRVRAASCQTDSTKPPASLTTTSTSTVSVQCKHQTTQTDHHIYEHRSPLPRVVDVSPKSPSNNNKSSSPNGGPGGGVVGSLGSWATADEDERPSVERRSYSSRIPTPIKPLKTAVTTPVTSLSSLLTPGVKRELPDTPRPHQLVAKGHHHQPSRYIHHHHKVELAKVPSTPPQPTANPPPSVRPSKSFWGAWWRL